MEKYFAFDLFNFDENGEVCASKKIDLAHARSNFLYLIAKYNQNFLQERKQALPTFFKEDLGEILAEVENGGDFKQAKSKLFEACLEKTQGCVGGNDKEWLSNLNEKIIVADKAYAKKFQNVVNSLQLTYIITGISGKVLDEILFIQTQEENKENKSKLYKEIIKYNSLVSTASKVKENKVLFDEVKNMAGWANLLKIL